MTIEESQKLKTGDQLTFRLDGNPDNPARQCFVMRADTSFILIKYDDLTEGLLAHHQMKPFTRDW